MEIAGQRAALPRDPPRKGPRRKLRSNHQAIAHLRTLPKEPGSPARPLLQNRLQNADAIPAAHPLPRTLPQKQQIPHPDVLEHALPEHNLRRKFRSADRGYQPMLHRSKNNGDAAQLGKATLPSQLGCEPPGSQSKRKPANSTALLEDLL